jgi:hypothetical protein
MAWGWGALPAGGDVVRALNQRMPALSALVDRLERLLTGTVRVPPTATTISVGGVRTAICEHASATTITAIREGGVGQHVTLVFRTASTTLAHSGSLRLIGGANFTPAAGAALAFVTVDGSNWTEVGR